MRIKGKLAFSGYYYNTIYIMSSFALSLEKMGKVQSD